MKSIEHRAVIKFFTLQGKEAAAILDEMAGVYGTNTPSLRTILEQRDTWINAYSLSLSMY